MFKRFVWISLIVVSGALLAASLFGASIPAVGSAAPDFTLNSQDGNPVSLSQFRGKWVVLYFYPRDMTRDAPSRHTTSSATRRSSRPRMLSFWA